MERTMSNDNVNPLNDKYMKAYYLAQDPDRPGHQLEETDDRVVYAREMVSAYFEGRYDNETDIVQADEEAGLLRKANVVMD